MAVIIGAGTTVSTSLFLQGGITSVSFGFKPQVNRLWQLGSWDPYDTYTIQQRELTLAGYGRKDNGQGGSQSFDLTPSTSCVDASSVAVTVNPGSCGVVVTPFTDDFYPTSYGYTKDNFGWGVENWSFTSKPIIENYTGTIVFLRGIATGQMLVGAGQMVGADMGVVINDSASRDSSNNYIEGANGSVQAGFPGVGDYATQREVVVSFIGASIGKSDGYKGQASVTIPVQQVFI